MTKQEKQRIFEEYSADNMKKLRQIIYPYISKFGGVSQMDFDDFLSCANLTLWQLTESFDSTRGVPFEAYLRKRLPLKIMQEKTYSGREKRTPYVRDKNGKKITDENGKFTVIQTVSVEALAEEGTELYECSFADVENGCELSENVQSYLETLGNTERLIAELIIQGYGRKEIKERLGITENKYKKLLKNMGGFEQHIMLNKKMNGVYKEEKKHMDNWTQTFERSKTDKMSIKTINDKIDGRELLFNHPLQRDSEQWSPAMKGNLISDILQKNPLPSLIFAEQIINGLAIIWDLDGKQRCTNAYSFAHDGYKISKNIRRWNIPYQTKLKDKDGQFILDENGIPKSEKRDFDIRNKKFSELPKELQDSLLNYNFEIVQYLNCSPEDISYHIARYNDGKPMNSQQKGIICLGEEFAALVKSISAMPFFKEKGNYTVKETNNGTVNRVVVESIMASNFLHDWKKEQLEMCEFIQKNATQETFDEFEDMVERITRVATDDILEIFNSKNSFLWFGLFKRFRATGLSDGRFIEFMEAFSKSLHSKEINGMSFDELCVDKKTGKAKSTKDKYIVVSKIKLLDILMNEYFGINKGGQ